MKLHRNGHNFPTNQHKTLLQALLADEKLFSYYWMSWKHDVPEYQKLDDATFRLFPLVYTKLVHLLPDDTWLNVTKRVYQSHWLRNQLLYQSVARELQSLQLDKINFRVIKGGAYIPLYYSNELAIRPLEDIDIFCAPQDALTVIHTFKARGWELSSDANLEVFNPDFNHAVSLKKERYVIDVHFHLLHNFLSKNDWKLFTAESYNVRFLNTQVQTLSDTVHLLHICVHGLKWNASTQLFWIIDAVQVIRKGAVDWQKLLNLSRISETNLSLLVAFLFLKDEFRANIPTYVIEQLGSSPVSLSQRRKFQLHLDDIVVQPLATIENYWWQYYDSVHSYSIGFFWLSQLLAFIKYLCQTTTIYKIPLILAQRLVVMYRRKKITSCFFT